MAGEQQLPLLLPKHNVGPRTEPICATTDKRRMRFCLRPLDHKGKHCNEQGERW